MPGICNDKCLHREGFPQRRCLDIRKSIAILLGICVTAIERKCLDYTARQNK